MDYGRGSGHHKNNRIWLHAKVNECGGLQLWPILNAGHVSDTLSQTVACATCSAE